MANFCWTQWLVLFKHDHVASSNQPQDCTEQIRAEYPSRSRKRSKIKNRNQELVHPKRTPKGSVHLAPSWTCPLLAPVTLAIKNQSHHCLPYISSLADFSGPSSLLVFSLSSFTTSYSMFLLPINDEKKIYPSFKWSEMK